MNKVFIQKGDLVIFDDKHKIYVGDSMDVQSYDFIDKKATLTLTSPPYNVGKNNYDNENTKKYLERDSDIKSDENYHELLSKSLQNGILNSEYVFYNIQHLSGNKKSLIEWLYDFRFNLVDTMIWRKTTTNPVIEPNILNSDFEYIYIYSDKDNAKTKHIKVGSDFRGTISNVIEMPRNHGNEYAKIHSALMPLHLVDYIIETFTNEGNYVLDMFSGLGTTFIGCLKSNRTYYGIEIEPLYVQETIKRFLEYDMGDRNIYIIRNGKKIPFSEFKDYVLGKRYNIFDFLEDNT